jgi:hypothetical protein
LYFGLEKIGVGIRDENAFFSQLSELQEASFHSRQRMFHRTPFSEPLDAASIAKITQTVCDSVLDDANAAKNLEPHPEGSQSDVDVAAESKGSATVASLRIGAHVLFRDDSHPEQVMRLTWISSNARVFLFNDLQASHELSITSVRLQKRFDEYSAVPLK